MPRLGVWSKNEFKRRTTPQAADVPLKKRVTKALDGRGSHIRLIDASLEAWDGIQSQDPGLANAETTRAKIKTLRSISKACAYWLSIKPIGVGASTLRTHRHNEIKVLMAQAVSALSHFNPAEYAYAKKKTAAIVGGLVTNPVVTRAKIGSTVKSVGGFSNSNATPLSGSYALERQTYAERVKPQLQPGDEHWSPAAGAVHDFANNWDTLTLDGYVGVYTQITKNLGAQGVKNKQVTYLPKSERLQYMVIVHGGGFVKPDGANYATNPARVGNAQDRVGDMWAMDRYGNLFIKASPPIQGRGYFNHSSFCAGNEVICAGGIVINNGQLAYIDNMSGHYKPDRDALAEACTILRDDGGVAFAGKRVGVRQADGSVANFDGADFLADNNVAWNHANDAALNLSAVIPLE